MLNASDAGISYSPDEPVVVNGYDMVEYSQLSLSTLRKSSASEN